MDEAWEAFDTGWLDALRRDGMQGLVDMFALEEPDTFLQSPPPWALAMFLRGDPQALLAIQSRELIGEGIPTLEGFPVPALLIAGEFEDQKDDAAVTAATIANGESLRLPGLGHADAQVVPEIVIPVVRVFLDRWFPEPA